ncbi:hypothetical protein, partial [Streptomyces sp. BE133]|uniref:hypothetical protein n=1 Tax=Streptomyces sp. BE133 TaxID=3002523 RepID=UPI002E78880E
GLRSPSMWKSWADQRAPHARIRSSTPDRPRTTRNDHSEIKPVDPGSAVYAYVRDELGSLILRERASNPESFQVTEAVEAGVGRLICPLSLCENLQPRYIAATGEWMLGIQLNPAVEWWFSKIANGLLYPGRFYSMPASSYPDFGDRGQLDEFAAMANRLFRWVRSWTVIFETEWGVERVGPVAAELLRSGDIALRRNPPGSRL